VPERSAGLLLHRRAATGTEVLIAHMGGPFWARRDAAAWSIPKGLTDDGEDPLQAARREFTEEMGSPPPDGTPVALGEFRQRSGKVVVVFAQEGDFDIEAPFRALFADPAVATGLGEEEVTPEELAVDPHAWVGKPLPASVLLNSEQRCLAEAIYFEARGESYNGQVAVSQVVLNRVRNPAYPNTICGVVYQNRKMRNACQFSFACDLVPDRVVDDRHWRQAQEIARETTAGRLKIPEIEASTHYHATYVKPRWAKSMQKQKQIGLHIFYKTYGGGWS